MHFVWKISGNNKSEAEKEPVAQLGDFDYGAKARVKTPQIYMKQYGWDETRSSWYSFMHSVHMRTHGIQVDRILNDGVSTICDPD